MKRWTIYVILMCMYNTMQAQLMPAFYFSHRSDTLLRIEPQPVQEGKPQTFIFIMGAPTPGIPERINWFRAYMDTAHYASQTGHDLVHADTLNRYGFTSKGEIIADGEMDSLDIFYPSFTVVEINKGQDSTRHIFQVVYTMQVNVGLKKVIETRKHYYEYYGTSAEEAYALKAYTLFGWNIPGKKRQLWMLGCADSYLDIPNNQVFSLPVVYFGLR